MRTRQPEVAGPGWDQGNRLNQDSGPRESAGTRARIGPYTLVGAVEVEEQKRRRGRPRREVRASPDCWALPGGGTASVRELRRIAARNGWSLVLPQGADYLRAMRAHPLYYVACHTTNWDRLGSP